MIKRLLVLLLLMALLAACGGGDDADDSDPAGTTGETTTEQTDAPTQAEDNDDAEAAEAGGDTLVVDVADGQVSFSSVDNFWETWSEGVRSADLQSLLTINVDVVPEDLASSERALERFLFMPSDAEFTDNGGALIYISESTDSLQTASVKVDDRTAITFRMNMLDGADRAESEAALLAAMQSAEYTPGS